jgi:transposase
VDAVPHGPWKTTTRIAALDGAGLRCSMVLAGAVNALAFETFVREILVPTLRPGDLVILDNLSSHKGPRIGAWIRAAQAEPVYLPPYSPDFHPLEPAFRKIKQALRSTRIIEDLPEHLQPVVTEHTIHRDYCPQCKRHVEPVVPDALPGATLGHRVVSLASWCHYSLGVTLAQLIDIFQFHLQTKLSAGGLTRRWAKRHADRIELFELPGYSPDLNPDEPLNQDVKSNALGRKRPADREEMIQDVRSYLWSTQRQPEIIRNYFRKEHVRYAAA